MRLTILQALNMHLNGANMKGVKKIAHSKRERWKMQILSRFIREMQY